MAKETLKEDSSPLTVHHLMVVLIEITKVIKNINQDLKTLNLFGISIISTLILTKIDDLVNNPFEFHSFQGFPIVVGLFDASVFVYFVIIASNVRKEYNTARVFILSVIAKNRKFFSDVTRTVNINVFLQVLDKLLIHFQVSCLGLFDFRKSILLTTFGCALTYGALLMHMN
ncbi:hypothetical protein TNCV_189791 [Trichonephila clavipes]|nr:hypothetical protein TNCV_189791 [Trichonephila clavipes]